MRGRVGADLRQVGEILPSELVAEKLEKLRYGDGLERLKTGRK
jgi:hypothetical protein